ncbi:1-phosphofructokinase family hexose kinase [Pontivivens nitratireducens]|uniref:Phosphofructokinase n=1 Tax=Pontivivens nitratireducens TaxID=2758038 RepID=A0A6G7VN65_9RHOB|nr:1-phosphofructokinase family hexose kinase [Pontibrevibacter nitratireducens]QIK41489.1 1-phosphofructokinase family hexose kinase [Pontibrevibacter nitratireducens]
MVNILTITLNSAVDLATSVDEVVAGPKLYCAQPSLDAGGGGVNVARAIRKLGGDATALVTVGGAMGETLLQLLKVEGVPVVPVPIHGETRFSFAVTDGTSGAQYRFNLPGETLTTDEGARLLTSISDVVGPDDFVVLSGGVAPGLGDDFPLRVQQTISRMTDRLIVDTSQAPLAHLIANPVDPIFLLRIDRKEAETAAGHAMETIADSVTFASDLIERGVARIVVTGRGAEGSVLVTRDARYFCRAVEVPVRSTIGAGDSLVGAMILAFARGEQPDQALRRGVAAACATVSTPATELCSRAEAEALFQRCEVTAI